MAVTPQELARTLIQRARAQRERSEAEAAQLRTALTEWAKTVAASRVWLIGSLAWGRFGPHSDVDVVVEGMAPELETRAWSQLCDLTHRSVDLLPIGELPEDFADRVRKEGLVLK